MAKINMNTVSCSHRELHTLLKTVGTSLTVVIMGEPGIGKSAILGSLSKELPKHVPVYVDAPVFDIPDIMMPMVDTDERITHFAPNALWGFQTGKPLLIMIDELLKASGPTKLILTRLILERTLGAFKLPEGSIVFATSNNTTDGVGDNIAAHLQNRICQVSLRKPSAKEWLQEFAFSAGVAPEICAWVKSFPHAMDSYVNHESGKFDNPYCFDPKKNKGAFVSPRSLAKASDIVNNRHALGATATKAALGGLLGYSAAGDMQAYLDVADKLPAFETIVADWRKTPMPEKDPSAMLVLMFGLAARVTEETIGAVTNYVCRATNEEYQMLFMSALTQNNTKRFASSTKCITQWHLDHKHLLISDIDD